MPADNRFRLNDGESASPAGPEAAQDDPEGSVGGPDDRTPAGGECGELLAQGEVFEQEGATGPEGEKESRCQCREESDHRSTTTGAG